jgi:hypothetical protein
MLSALQHGVKGKIARKANGAIVAVGRERDAVLRGMPQKACLKRFSHAYASFRVLTLYARDAGQKVFD